MSTPMTVSIKEALEQIASVETSLDKTMLLCQIATMKRVAAEALASLESGDARERTALAEMVFKTVKFADMAAGEGIFFDDLDPANILSDYATAIDADCWDGIAEVARDAILATGCVPVEAAKATDGDEAYEIGKRDEYESAIQDIDIATGGDGEFRGSTIPDETVDVPAMKARVIERLRDESRLRQCTICGFTVDTSFAAVKPSADFTTRGRAKSLPNESAIRADEREKCAQEAFTAVTHVVIPDDGNTTLADHVAAAIRAGGAK